MFPPHTTAVSVVTPNPLLLPTTTSPPTTVKPTPVTPKQYRMRPTYQSQPHNEQEDYERHRVHYQDVRGHQETYYDQRRKTESSQGRSHQRYDQVNHGRFAPKPSQRHQTGSIADCPMEPEHCRPPNCHCSRTGLDIPGDLATDETPQMVLITFQGPVTDRVINRLKALFDGKFRNPNRCRISGTLFAEHPYNNYDQTQWLLSHGMEVGISSMSGEDLSGEHERRWYDEIVGMRAALEKFSYANRSAIVGVRAPNLHSAGDSQMRTLTHLGLMYDSSLRVENGPFWPQTLEFRPPWNCSAPKQCVRSPHRRLWEFPMGGVEWAGREYADLAQLASALTARADLANALRAHLDRHVRANRAPMQLPLSADFLNALPDADVVNALQEFVTEALKRGYVHFVSMSQAVEWMKRPTRLSKLSSLPAWGCKRARFATIQPCENPATCTFMNSHAGSPTPHAFRVCGSCPNVYPWLNDPVGSGL